MERWLQEHLVCPRDHTSLCVEDTSLLCARGHTYPYVDGIPIMLLADMPPTHVACSESLARAAGAPDAHPNDGHAVSEEVVDSYVQRAVAGTCGYMYRGLMHRLTAYPIPELRLPRGSGQYFLDIGCNWGRWCISAARKGYVPIGIDPDLDAIRAAHRVAGRLGIPAVYVVADARRLPFAAGTFDVVFSYSVLQHFEKEDVNHALAEIARTMKVSGTSVIQMPNVFGLRNLYHQCRRGLRSARSFEVRYWRPSELRSAFGRFIGRTRLSVDGYFSLNAQTSDRSLLPSGVSLVVSCSELLRRLSERIPGLLFLADSLYVTSIREERTGTGGYGVSGGQ